MMTWTSVYTLTWVGNKSVTSLAWMDGIHCLPCSPKFSLILGIEILSTNAPDFLKKVIFLRNLISGCICQHLYSAGSDSQYFVHTNLQTYKHVCGKTAMHKLLLIVFIRK